MMKGNLISTATLLIVLLILAGCQGGNNQQGDQAQSDTTKKASDTTQATEEEKDKVASLLLPSPLQIASIFKKAGLSYTSGVTNEPQKASDYISRSSKLLNIGVYSTDLSYCILNKQSQKASKYLSTIKKLTKKAGMAGIFKSNNYFERFEQNKGNQDSIMAIMEEIQVNMDTYINQNQLQDQATVIFTGAWIEAMHIGMKSIESNNNQKLTARLLEQLTMLENLLNNLKAQSNKSEELKTVIVQLEKLNKRFDAFVKQKRQESNKNQEISIEAQELKGISKQVDKIRKQIIQV